MVGHLSAPEKDCLKEFKKIIQKRGFGDRGLDAIFYNNIRYYKDISDNKILNNKEKKVILKTFRVFENKFEIWWQKNKNTTIPVLLKRRVRRHDFKKIVRQLEKFFNNQKVGEAIVIIDLAPDSQNFGGRAQTINQKNFIELEIPSVKHKLDDFILLLIHEASHLLILTPHFINLVKKYYSAKISDKNIQNFSETIINNLAPRGYFFKKNAKSVTGHYLKNNKIIDLNYLRAIKK